MPLLYLSLSKHALERMVVVRSSPRTSKHIHLHSFAFFLILHFSKICFVKLLTRCQQTPIPDSAFTRQCMGKMTQIMSFKVWWKALARLQALHRKRCRLLSTRGSIWGAPCRNLGHLPENAPSRNDKGSAGLSGNTDFRTVQGSLAIFQISVSLLRSFAQGQGHAWSSNAYHANRGCTYQHL